MSTLALLGVLFAIPCEPAGEPIRWDISKLGQTAIVRLNNAPFPHASRADGFKSGEKLYPRDPHYTDNSVA
ncbi:MAG: hypothetical protein GX616_11455, partial [Planctomycetes bacterium]|nr:hypothetical protein [Planctomycetota bacterium]